MIDDPEKVTFLVTRLEDRLPLRARVTSRLADSLRERSSGMIVPRECDVVAVHYLGDEGGIMCALDFGVDNVKEVHLVSITHLAFRPSEPFAREIEAYQRHRVKKIRQHQGRGY
jgi:hypothetical protein